MAQSIQGSYFDLEQDKDRLRLDLMWESIKSENELVILDEAQTWPDIFPRLRGAIDEDRKRYGRFLFLGSVSPILMTEVSESLAGRLSLIELTPFLLTELSGKKIDDLWLYGGYPDGGILDSNQFPQWQHDYLNLLVQRDLPNWGLPAKPQMTFRLLKMVAATHGQTWNASQLGQSLGISHPTVNDYMSYLEGVYLLRRLQPYQSNLRKRLVKSPKYYWRDTGLLHAISNIKNYDHLLSQPWVGASWEGFVIEQILGIIENQSIEAYYLKTSDNYEVDLILDFGSTLWAIEIKLSSQPRSQDLNQLNKTADLISAEKRILISRVSSDTITKDQISCSLAGFLNFLKGK